ncbi:DUF4236 domain-containing protein [Sinomonas sp. G460-2]|uniref:DUF4236 domain-containing protein n=1 Tax=Sinomonas sp. G460-2 TaxID=3393464 RepID=UPI0039EF5773
MGLIFRKRVRLSKGLWLNLSRSGASVSARVGRTTVNSRGRATTKLGKGLYWRSGK